MRMVLALIQPTKLKAVQEALHKIGVERMTVCDALGYGQQRGQSIAGRTAAESESSGKAILLRKVALEIAVNEDFLDRTVDTIAQIARNGPAGSIGDGKIFVVPVEQAVRIRTGDRGADAI
jgi:nitrogen regulatory protein P-II 2